MYKRRGGVGWAGWWSSMARMVLAGLGGGCRGLGSQGWLRRRTESPCGAVAKIRKLYGAMSRVKVG